MRVERSLSSITALPGVVVVLLLAACTNGPGGNRPPPEPPPPGADTTPPSVPGDVMVTALSASQLQVTWTESTDSGTGVSGYRVFRDGGSAPVATVTATTYTDSGLIANTTYSYSVLAFDGATPPNESAQSSVVSESTLPAPAVDTTPPTVPSNVTATAQSPTQIRVVWSPSTDASGISGYRVFRNGGATPIATVQTTNYTDSGLTPDTGYSYTISAVDGASPANESAPSVAVTESTPPMPVVDTTPPTVPSNVTATAQSPTQISLTWNASTDASGISGYRVFRNGGTTPIATVQTTSYTDSGLTAATQYTYRVSAVDGADPANESAQSAVVTESTPPVPADTTPPTVPGNVTATAQSSTQIRVTWSASTDASGISGYRVFRDGGTTPVATVQTTSYTDSGLTASTQYRYRVSAVDNADPANESALSAEASATTGTPASSGLDSRPSNTTCLAGDAPSSTLSLAVERAFPNLTFNQPVELLQEPGNNARWYVVEKPGVIRRFNNVANASSSEVFADVTEQVNTSDGNPNDERGLLGMAFHPDYPDDPRVFLFYTGLEPGLSLVERVSQFRVGTNGLLDENSELPLFIVDDPAGNHNGGHIAFGPDGYLYIGIGDGGSGNDPWGDIGNGQNLRTMLGKMLRIDIANSTAANTYAIPSDNPFAGNPRCNATGASTSANCPEIFAYGLRNPWRWSFDRVSGELWLNDVGQGQREEVDIIVRGGNYGWRCLEGTQGTGLACGPNPNPIPPVAQYPRSAGFSTTGGYVYRGSAIPMLQGRYVFADFGSGNLWHIARDTSPTLNLTAGSALSTGLNVASFGEDANGELYIVHLGGTLHRLVQAGGGGGGQIPTLLSETGCVNPSNPTQPASGLIPYAPNAPFFSDNAVKTRWLALPDGQRIAIGTDDDFDFPNGSVLVKNFELGTRLVETRLFMRHNDGSWAGYTYEWNAQGTEATRVVGGKTVTVAGQTWQFPSESQCMQCHTAAAGRTLGLEVGQLNGDFGYPTGRTANQLVTLDTIDTLTPPLTGTPEELPVIPDPFGSAPIGQRARAWLHTNCSNCHRPGGGAQSNMDLRYTTSLLNTQACDVAPTLGDLGIANPRLIAPGSAARSVVVARVNRTGTDAMPPLARHLIDTQGVQLLSAWIDGLTGCN